LRAAARAGANFVFIFFFGRDRRLQSLKRRRSGASVVSTYTCRHDPINRQRTAIPESSAKAAFSFR
jgi:hypothetical protein